MMMNIKIKMFASHLINILSTEKFTVHLQCLKTSINKLIKNCHKVTEVFLKVVCKILILTRGLFNHPSGRTKNSHRTKKIRMHGFGLASCLNHMGYYFVAQLDYSQ